MVRLGGRIPLKSGCIIFSSPMQRCRQSCQALSLQQKIHYNKSLREIDFGEWEGLSFTEICEKDPDKVDEWAKGFNTFCFPNGECVQDFLTRVHDAARKISNLEAEQIIIVSHGGVIRALLCFWLGLDPKNYILFQIDKGKYASLELFDDLGVLTGFNLG